MKFWWNQELNELKKAKVSHRDWVLSRKPKQEFISDLRKKDRYTYRHKIRQEQAKEKLSITNSLHEALMNKNQLLLESLEKKIWFKKRDTKSH